MNSGLQNTTADGANQPSPPVKSLNVDKEIWKRVRMFAVENDRQIKEVVETAVKEYLDRCHGNG